MCHTSVFEVLKAILAFLEHVKQGQSSGQRRCSKKDDEAQHSNTFQGFVFNWHILVHGDEWNQNNIGIY